MKDYTDVTYLTIFCLQMHTRLLAMQSKHWLAVLKQKPDNKKGIAKDSCALFCRFAMTGDHNKVHNLKGLLMGLHSHQPTERASFVLGLYPCGWSKLGVTPREEHTQDKQWHIQKSKAKRQKCGKSFCERTLLLLLMMNSLKKRRLDNSNWKQ